MNAPLSQVDAMGGGVTDENQLVKIQGPVTLLIDGEPEAKRMRWMIGARDRMEKVASIDVFFEKNSVVVAIPLLETAEGMLLDVKFVSEVVAKAAAVGMSEALKEAHKREVRRLKREAKKAAARS